MHTRWIETEFDNTGPAVRRPPPAAAEDGERETVVVEVGGKRLEVTLPGRALGAGTAAAAAPAGRKPARRAGGAKAGRRRQRRLADLPDAGHHRQDRGRRG